MTTLITGSTSGIGKETAIKMANFGSDLILPVRNIEKGNNLKQEILSLSPQIKINIYECDLGSMDSISDFVKKLVLDEQKFDVLINNAGTWNTKYEVTNDGFEKTFGVNHLAMFLLTSLILKNNLLQGENDKVARIVNLSSMANYMARVNWDDLELKQKFDSSLAYYNSKFYNVLFTQKLARIFIENNQNITSNCLHPGIVNTNLLVVPSIVRRLFGWMIMTPEKGSRTSFFVATDPSLEKISGQYFDNCKIKAPNKLSSIENQDKLWEITVKILEKWL